MDSIAHLSNMVTENDPDEDLIHEATPDLG